MPGVDYEETYSPVMDGLTFRFLIAMVASNKLDMQLMDVVTAYQYELLEKDIYMKTLTNTSSQTLQNSGICSILNYKNILMG